jgi:hypothetical protein
MESINKIKALAADAIGALTALWGWLGWFGHGLDRLHVPGLPHRLPGGL